MEEEPNTNTNTPTPTPTTNGKGKGKGSSIGIGAPTSASSSSNSRWNPTKEQISMLETLYRQGIRTPTAEQIQQIAARLREFGSIEGKNVFYWFQNHKARQRQKQKQESLATLSRFFRRAAAASTNPVLPPLMPIPPPPCANVVCSQFCYPPQGSGIAYYPQVLLPRPVTMRATTDHQMYEKVKAKNHQMHPSPPPPHDNLEQRPSNVNSTETLQLFPLHPTGVLQERSSNRSVIDEDGDEVGEEVGADARPVLSFF